MRCLLLVAALGLTACSGDAATPIADPSRAPTVGSFRSQPVDWFLLVEPTDELEIGYHMGGIASDCERAGDVDVDETPEAVTVTAHKLVRTEADACTVELMLAEEAVTLDEPLGDRELRGCAQTSDPVDEDATCRDLGRARDAGFVDPRD